MTPFIGEGVRFSRLLAFGVGLATLPYLAYVALAFVRYGSRGQTSKDEFGDPLLDQIMPTYEVVERRHKGVRARTETTFAAACHLDLNRSAIVRSIFRAREMLLGGNSGEVIRALGLVDQAKAWGWAVLLESPGREIVFGAVTQPWVANPIFRGLPAYEFLIFHEPGYIKIAWSLAADPVGPDESVARTETRVVATDAVARSKFRIYWAFLSPGMILIRLLALGLVKAEAERVSRAT